MSDRVVTSTDEGPPLQTPCPGLLPPSGSHLCLGSCHHLFQAQVLFSRGEEPSSPAPSSGGSLGNSRVLRAGAAMPLTGLRPLGGAGWESSGVAGADCAVGQAWVGPRLVLLLSEPQCPRGKRGTVRGPASPGCQEDQPTLPGKPLEQCLVLGWEGPATGQAQQTTAPFISSRGGLSTHQLLLLSFLRSAGGWRQYSHESVFVGMI